MVVGTGQLFKQAEVYIRNGFSTWDSLVGIYN